MDAISLFLLIVAGVTLRFLYKAQQKRGDRQPDPPRIRPPTIEDLQPGGVLSLRGIGADLEDLDVTVTGRHSYSEEGFEWLELEGETGDRKVWIGVERDDELEVSITLRKVDLETLGLTPERLEEFRRQRKGAFAFEGQTYRFDESGRATFFRDGNRLQGEPFEYWDFVCAKDDSAISIESWKPGGAPECHVSQTLKPSQYTVYATRGDGNP
ncbi:MAG: DUF4178 domain-containing protein [Magnetococcales bacterium]|nr:DUF4178 domain-containing protein [Magnetococcales bacterium]